MESLLGNNWRQIALQRNSLENSSPLSTIRQLMMNGRNIQRDRQTYSRSLCLLLPLPNNYYDNHLLNNSTFYISVAPLHPEFVPATVSPLFYLLLVSMTSRILRPKLCIYPPDTHTTTIYSLSIHIRPLSGLTLSLSLSLSPRYEFLCAIPNYHKPCRLMGRI